MKSNNGIKSLGVAIPNGAQSLDPEKTYTQMRETGQFVLAPNSNGFYFRYFDKTINAYTMAITGKTDRNGRGSPLFIPFNTLIHPISKKEEPLINYGPELKNTPRKSLLNKSEY
jgi:hypothetical protein